MMKQPQFDFSLTGFIIAIILIAMFMSLFATMMTETISNYNITGNNSFEKYNITEDILQDTKDIREATNIKQQTGFLDVIGGYFTSGVAALQTAFHSFELFSGLMNDAAQDVEGFAFFRSYIVTIILIIIFVGIALAVLLKWRI